MLCQFFKSAGNCVLSDKVIGTVTVVPSAEYDPEDPLSLEEPFTGPCSFY